MRKQPPVVTAVGRFGCRIADALVRVRGHDVERAAGAGGIGPGQEAVVVVHETAEDDPRIRVARLDRRVSRAKQSCVPPCRAAPEVLVVGLVPDLPRQDSSSKMARHSACNPSEVSSAARRCRFAASPVGPVWSPEERGQHVHAFRADEIDAAVGEAHVPRIQSMTPGLERPPADVDAHGADPGGGELRRDRAARGVALAPCAVELHADGRAEPGVDGSRDGAGRARGAHQEGDDEGDATGDRAGDYSFPGRTPLSNGVLDAFRPPLDWNPRRRSSAGRALHS